MVRIFALLALAVLLLGLASRNSAGDPTSVQVSRREPAKKADAPASEAPSAKVYRVEKGLFKIEVALKGTLEAAEMTEVAFKHHGGAGWGAAAPLTIVKVVEHGAKVKKGDVLISFDLKKIDLALRELEAERKIAELNLQVAREEFPLLQKTWPLDMAAAERGKKQADEDLKRFLETDKAQMAKGAIFGLKQAKSMLENAKDELRHLEKMYKANDLTEETEEIVLKRQRSMVELAAFYLEGAESRKEQTFKSLIPRQEQGLKDSAIRMDIALAKAKKTYPLLNTQKELNFKKLEYEDAKATERLDNMRKDRDAMIVKAPADGVVYYGKCTNGQWAAAPKLIPGQNALAEEVLMTIVKPRPLMVRTTVEEKDALHVRAGTKGKAEAIFNPTLKLGASVARIAAVPSMGGNFETIVNIDLDKNAVSLMPGMACTIKLMAYLKKDALAVPSSAVHTEDGEDEKQYVVVAGKDGKHQKRTVTLGPTSGDRVEILSGLEEGETILLERPSEKKTVDSTKKGAP